MLRASWQLIEMAYNVCMKAVHIDVSHGECVSGIFISALLATLNVVAQGEMRPIYQTAESKRMPEISLSTISILKAAAQRRRGSIAIVVCRCSSELDLTHLISTFHRHNRHTTLGEISWLYKYSIPMLLPQPGRLREIAHHALNQWSKTNATDDDMPLVYIIMKMLQHSLLGHSGLVKPGALFAHRAEYI